MSVMCLWQICKAMMLAWLKEPVQTYACLVYTAASRRFTLWYVIGSYDNIRLLIVVLQSSVLLASTGHLNMSAKMPPCKITLQNANVLVVITGCGGRYQESPEPINSCHNATLATETRLVALHLPRQNFKPIRLSEKRAEV